MGGIKSFDFLVQESKMKGLISLNTDGICQEIYMPLMFIF